MMTDGVLQLENSPEEESAVTANFPLTVSASLEEGRGQSNNTKTEVTNYLQGLQLHIITIALCLCLFLTNLEIPIVSTSLVGITDHLKGFSQRSWIVTAYLLTFIGFLIIWSKLSDIFGRKLTVITSVVTFVVFSGACGASQNTTQLIVFRAFQGIGGSGIYSVCMVIIFELIPPTKFACYTSIVSVVFVLSLLLGPILGGVINTSSTWRWVFLLNVPAGVIAAVALTTMIPPHFPHHGQPSHESEQNRKAAFRSFLKRVDFPGAIFLLVATLLPVTALEEAGSHFPWKSAFVITLLAVSGLVCVAFLAWERYVTKAKRPREPVFPWRFVQSRVWIGMLLNAFFLGAPFNVAIFLIPQRLQIVNGTSPLGAGIRLLPFTCAAPVGSIVSSMLAGKVKVPPIYLVIAASLLQVVGFSLLSILPVSKAISAAQYGYEVIAGFGVGVNISTLILMTPYSVQKRDQAVALGSVGQFRYMGGAIGLGIVTSVLNGYVRSHLGHFLSPDQVRTLLQSNAAILALSPDQQEMTRVVFGRGYNLQMKILIGLAAAQLPGSLVMWQKKQILVD